MGKCKRRTLHKTNSCYFMTREGAINNVFNSFAKTQKKNRFDYKKAMETISLFGLSAEELSEAVVSYENLRALGCVIS